MSEMESLRKDIANITRKIIQLIGTRNEIARRIGELKRLNGLPLQDEDVELKLRDQVINECKNSGVSEDAGLKVLSVLLSESKRIQGLDRDREVISLMSIFTRVRELERSGRRLIRLDVGEPDFEPPKVVVNGCIKALMESRTHYTEARGIPELIDAIREYIYNKYNREITNDEAIVTFGGRFAIISALQAIMREGDSCLIIDPSWPAYKQVIRYIGCRDVAMETSIDNGWEVDIEALKEKLNSVRAIILSYPTNPNGKIISRDKFNEIVELCNEKDVTIISDEIYNSYAYRDCPSILDTECKSFIYTTSFSKSWAMTGFRIGFAISSREIISKMAKIQSLMLTSLPEFIQYGAINALKFAAEDVKRNSEIMRRRIELACSELDKIENISYYKPDGAMYIFPMIKKEGIECEEFCSKLLNEKGVSVVPGKGFGNYAKFFRISLGRDGKEIVEGIRRIGEFLR